MRLRYVHRFTDRHGVVRHYFRRHGMRVTLPGKPGEPAFMEAYQSALNGVGAAPPPAARTAHPEGSVGALVGLYLTQSLEHSRNKSRTRHVTKLILERFAAKHGHRLVRQMRRHHIETILASMSGTPAAANDLLKKLRRLLNFAITKEWLTANPCEGITPFESGEHHTWTDAQLDAFEARWPIGTKERTSYALHLWTAQRSQDVRSMTWADISADAIRVIQGKTKVKLWVPLHPELKHALEHHKKEHALIIATAFGKPFTEKGYGQWMAKAIERAGLPEECVAHGLRKAGARRLAEAGATTKEIAAVTGHKTLKEVARYTDAADQRKLAETAIARLPERSAKVIGKP